MNLVKIIMTTSYRWNFIPKRRTNTFQIPINGLTIHVTDHKDIAQIPKIRQKAYGPHSLNTMEKTLETNTF